MDFKFNELQPFTYFLTDKISRYYYSGVQVDEGYLIVSERGKTYFIDARYYSEAKSKFNGTDVVVIKYTDKSQIVKFTEKQNCDKIGVNFSGITHKEYVEYLNLFGKPLYDISSELEDKRKTKTKYEIDLIKKACEITEKAFYKAIESVREGITEKELKKILVDEMLKLGAEKESFDTIVAFNANSAVPHHVSGDEKLKYNSVILIDTGCVYNGYCSDLTRTFYYGNPPEEFIYSYDKVLLANTTAEENITDGISGSVADALARESLREYQMDGYFSHSLGHGVGLEIHEQPYLSKKSTDTLKNGQVFTVEPGVYFEGHFGIRIEDTVVLNNGKAERLFTDSKELLIKK